MGTHDHGSEWVDDETRREEGRQEDVGAKYGKVCGQERKARTERKTAKLPLRFVDFCVG